LVFGLPDRSLVRLSVHDTTGRLVKLLIDRQLEPGWHKTTWDGRSEQGQRVASGLYLVELRADGRAIRQKLVLLK
jgi:flagellar hook assembly protein FlgD